MLTSEELERYARHIVLREVGGQGQAALKAAKVLVIGAGGLGAPALMYLAAAGIGTLGVVDDDTVTLSNLQRQIIHATSDVGRLKTQSAADSVRALNPHVAFVTHETRLDASNAMEIIGGYDIVVDGSDNFTTRYLVSDACYLAGKTLIAGALGIFDASLTTIRAHEKNADGEGVKVTGVEEDSPAADKGIRSGDVIVAVGGKSVDSPSDVEKGVADAKDRGRGAVLFKVQGDNGARFVGVPFERG